MAHHTFPLPFVIRVCAAPSSNDILFVNINISLFVYISFEKENETYQEIFSSTFSKLDLNPFQLTDNFAKHESKEAKLFR